MKISSPLYRSARPKKRTRGRAGSGVALEGWPSDTVRYDLDPLTCVPRLTKRLPAQELAVHDDSLSMRAESLPDTALDGIHGTTLIRVRDHVVHSQYPPGARRAEALYGVEAPVRVVLCVHDVGHEVVHHRSRFAQRHQGARVRLAQADHAEPDPGVEQLSFEERAVDLPQAELEPTVPRDDEHPTVVCQNADHWRQVVEEDIRDEEDAQHELCARPLLKMPDPKRPAYLQHEALHRLSRRFTPAWQHNAANEPDGLDRR